MTKYQEEFAEKLMRALCYRRLGLITETEEIALICKAGNRPNAKYDDVCMMLVAVAIRLSDDREFKTFLDAYSNSLA